MTARFHPRSLPLFGLCLCLLACPLLTGCSATPEIEELPPQTLTPTPPSDLNEPPVVASDEGVSALDLAPAEDEEVETAESTGKDSTLITIGGDETAEKSDADFRSRLLAASRKETVRRQNAEPAVVVINDKNLAEMAEGGNVTIASPPPERATSNRSGVPTDGQPSRLLEADLQHLTPEEQEEVYWRRRARQLRLDWRNAYDAIDELEEREAELRTRFYAEDDPFVRDGRIKPAWDRVLDRLGQARRDVTRYEDDLYDFLDEGRRAGALPGWLREGKELEPRIANTQERESTVDTMEPRVYGDPP